MNCQDAQADILRSFEETPPAAGTAELRAHLAGCASCTRFARAQKALDERLTVACAPPEMSPAFEAGLRRRIRNDTRRMWSTALPDAVHFVSCGVATLVCAAFLPFDRSLILTVGAAATLLIYVAMMAVRDTLDEVEEPAR